VTSGRCPNCGGLVRPDAEWCGQCFTRLDRSPSPPEGESSTRPQVPGPSPSGGAAPVAGTPDGPTRPAPSGADVRGLEGRTPVASSSGRRVRATDEGIVWACPTCDSENPIEATSCRTCGTPFGRLLEEKPPRPRVASGRAVAFSLLFPGLGHFVAGRGAEGLARAVLFAYAVATAVTILLATEGRPGPFLSLLAASAVVAIALYAVSAVDAGRAAGGQPALFGSRVLLYGGAALILLTVIVLVVVGIRASSAAR
jgi:ribosomal protein L40E/TM2 domain-containing membrane protein YozV